MASKRNGGGAGWLFLPLSVPGDGRPAGVLVAGMSTRLELDETGACRGG